jgi:pimeloyl-ACP methyl ester carboxylesterase
MHRSLLPVAVVCMLLACCTRPPSVAPLLGQEWTSIQGERAKLNHWMGRKATVFLTLDPSCPITQIYANDLEAFAEQYADKGVQMIGVYAGPFMHRQEAAAFAADAGLRFPQVVDSTCVLSMALQARVTPECFITGPDGMVVYRGAFDDRPVRQGRKKPEAGQHYLRNALDAYLATGKPQKEVVAVGCIVECEE